MDRVIAADDENKMAGALLLVVENWRDDGNEKVKEHGAC